MLPVVFEHLGDTIHNSIGTCLIGGEIVHGSSVAAQLPEGPFQDIGCSD